MLKKSLLVLIACVTISPPPAEARLSCAVKKGVKLVCSIVAGQIFGGVYGAWEWNEHIRKQSCDEPKPAEPLTEVPES